MVVIIKRRVSTPTIVVYLPSFFDFVQPDKAIITVNEKSPTTSVKIPIVLGMKNSFSVMVSGKPGVVIIANCVMAKSVTRKQPADKVAAFNMRLVSLSFLSDTSKLATTVIENPLNSELMRIVCLASSFQY